MGKVNSYTTNTKVKFYLFSAIGLIMFFVPVTINGSNTIFIDHIVTFIKFILGNFVNYLVILFIIYGIILSIVKKTWNLTTTSTVMFFFKILGLVCALMYVFKFGPEVFHSPNNLPFLFDKLAVGLTLIIPIGGMLLCLITGYGLMEFIGVFARPIMRPVFKTPGRSAIDAIASFVGSYSIGLLITNAQYEDKKYTKKEAAIVATGFSTVSATFMVIVAKTLDIMDYWLLYFIVTLVITFIVTAITIRIYPLAKMDNVYIDDSEAIDDKFEGSLISNALNEGLKVAEKSDNIIQNLSKSFFAGVNIGSSVVPTVLSIGLIGLLLGEHTMIFDFVGYLFLPFTTILGFSEPMLVAKASAISITEMLLPALLVKDADIVIRFSVAVMCVSEILFLSASIPCILSTKIPIKIKDLLIVWFLRVVISLILVAPIANILF